MRCIFVHGLGQNSSSWKEIVNELNIDSQINCPNIFDLCNGELNYNNLYNAFSKYCDTFSESLNICGLSLGGILALNYAFNNPQKVHSLILIGTQYRIPKHLMIFQNIILNLFLKKILKR